MTDKFVWRPTTQSSAKVTNVIKKSQFGDGYSQRVADGINPIVRAFDLTFSDNKEATMRAIVNFLDAHVGKSFFFTPMFGGEGYYAADDGYSYSNVGADVYTLTATFTQVYQA